MPNHPPHRGSANRAPACGARSARSIGAVARRVNFRQKWRGYLWQGRFGSFVMDEPYLLAAARYLELNAVRAARGQHGPAAPQQRQSALVALRRRFGASRTGPWRWFRTGRPCSIAHWARRSFRSCASIRARVGRSVSATFVERLEQMVGRVLRLQKPGRLSKLRRAPE